MPALMAPAVAACGARPSQLVHVQPGAGSPGSTLGAALPAQSVRHRARLPARRRSPLVAQRPARAARRRQALESGRAGRIAVPLAQRQAGRARRARSRRRAQAAARAPPRPPSRAPRAASGATQPDPRRRWQAPRPARPARRPSGTALQRPPATPRAACSCSCWRVKRWQTALPGAPRTHGGPHAHGRRARSAPSRARRVCRAAWTPSQRRAGFPQSVALVDTPLTQPCGESSAPDRAHRLEVIVQGSSPAKCVRLDLAGSFRLCGTPGNPTPPAPCTAAVL
jgi:hypothetical protein